MILVVAGVGMMLGVLIGLFQFSLWLMKQPSDIVVSLGYFLLCITLGIGASSTYELIKLAMNKAGDSK
jgi:hypothetical protein